MLFNEKLVNVIKILNTSGVRSVYGEMNRTERWTSKQAKKPPTCRPNRFGTDASTEPRGNAQKGGWQSF